MNSFPLEILTPDRPFWKQNAEMIVVKGYEGFLGILARHAPMLVQLVPGPLKIRQDNTDQVFAVGAGLLEVTSAGVTVLVDSAEATAIK